MPQARRRAEFRRGFVLGEAGRAGKGHLHHETLQDGDPTKDGARTFLRGRRCGLGGTKVRAPEPVRSGARVVRFVS